MTTNRDLRAALESQFKSLSGDCTIPRETLRKARRRRGYTIGAAALGGSTCALLILVASQLIEPRQPRPGQAPASQGSVEASSAPRQDDTPDRQVSDDKVAPDTPHCGKTNIASEEYGTDIQPASGPSGTEVTFTGTTLRGEDGRWAPSDRLEAWWNTNVPATEGGGGKPLRDGPIVRLARVDDMERCRFETMFTVPDVKPGRYKISVFVWDPEPSESYGLYLPHVFTVTEG